MSMTAQNQRQANTLKTTQQTQDWQDGAGSALDPANAFTSDSSFAAAPAPFGNALFSSVGPTSAVAGSSANSSAAPIANTGTTPGATTPAAGTTTTPAWFSNLSTASIKADITAADVNGVMSYAGLEKVFADVDATLTSTKSGLTAAEMADFKTITANLNNGVSTSGYLTSLVNDVVNGNAANATWTGGAATSTSLGNLAVNSSATQLNELIGKWFLGTDLPSSTVSLSGASTFSISYQTVAKPLFATSGPSMGDVNQGYLGDCYLLSSLAEVASQNASDITSMITSNGNGTYGVRFYENGQAQYVTVNSSLADNGTIFNNGPDMWASLVEKAYAQLQTSGPVTGNYINDGNSFSTIGNGGQPFYALEEITGASQINYYQASGSSWADWTMNSSLSTTAYTTGTATSSLLSTIAADIAKGDDVILSSMTNAKDSSGKDTLIADHAMSVYGYDAATNMLEIRNPWGSVSSGQYWDTTFEVSLATLQAAGDGISIDNAGTGTKPAPAPTPPTVTNQTAAQTWKLGQAVNFALPTNTFTDPQGQKLTYSAVQVNPNGTTSALPTWLSFNATTGAFTGNVPNTATGFAIKVTATDTSGLSASETFNVATPAAPPALASQTAAQTWKLGQAVNFALPTNTFTDPQGEKLTYSAVQVSSTGVTSALPSWLSFNATTGTFTGTVPNTATGFAIKVTATDTSGLSTSETFSVATPAAPPALASQTAAQTWKIGQAVNFALPTNTFTDPQGEKLTYSAVQVNSNGTTSALPSWLTFNAATGTFSGTVATPNSASNPTTVAGFAIKVTATDTSGLSASETFGVSTPASAPVLKTQTANQTWTEGSAINFALPSTTFADPQNEALFYSASVVPTTASGSTALPTWLKFNATTDTFSGTAPTTASTLALKVTATDVSGLSVSETFTATISAAAAKLSQAISSLPSTSSVSATLSQLTTNTSTTLAAATH